MALSLNFGFFSGKFSGGGINESMHILHYLIMYLKAFSSISGTILSKRGQDCSRHGLLLTSMSQGLKSQSIMKSRPKI